MVYARVTDDGVVITTTINKPSNLDGWTAVQGALPPRTIAEDTEPRLMLVDGQLVWQVGPTAEELSEERRKAYEEEADRYLIAMHGYEVEGNTAAAENCRQAYLAKKAEIRRRIV